MIHNNESSRRESMRRQGPISAQSTWKAAWRTVFVLAVAGCSRERPSDVSTPSAASSLGARAAAATSSAPGSAAIGKPAPDFTLKDMEGREVSLASFHGKIIVLEWFNPGCPFVKGSHTNGSLKGLAKKHAAEGVVWLAINSAARGKQGFEPSVNSEAAKTFGLEHPILRDETGVVGRAYSATNTPNMFVIDKNGVLVYSGAIDNSPDGEGETPTGGTLINYVDAAIDDLNAGRPVRTPVTKAYGCSVKYPS
jgi:alkyl hydroperoxide reductase subunit AhpC